MPAFVLGVDARKWFSSQTQKKDAPGFRPVHPNLCSCMKFIFSVSYPPAPVIRQITA